MNFQILLVLVVFSCSCKGNSYHEYSTFVTDEDFEHQFFSDELEDTNYTAESEELSKLRQEAEDAGYTTVEAGKVSFPPSEEEEGKKDGRSEESQSEESKNPEPELGLPGGHQTPNSKREDEITSEKHLDHLANIHQKVYSSYEDSFHNKDRDDNQPPMRRQISAWRDELSDADNAPWTMDAFSPRHGAASSQNDYFDDSGYAVDSLEQKNNSVVGVPLSLKELLTRDEQTPYYQKNYYYNYYPLQNGRKLNKVQKWRSGDEHESEEMTQSRENSSGRKLMRKSACKQYLQFLKYAFEKLDENNDYNYDYNEDYSEDWREKGSPRNHKVFAVHLLGPTLYVDNSGKVSQINTKGNSYQSIDGISTVPKTMSLKKDDLKPKASTVSPVLTSMLTRAERPTTLPIDNPYDQPKTTTELPWLNISLRTNLTAPNMTKERPIPEVQHRSTYGTRIEEEWRQQVGGDVYETTVRTKTEHTVFDEYDYGDTKPSYSSVNTYPPKWYPSEEYYRKLAKALGKKDNDTKSNIISSETNAAVGPSVYWYSPSPTPQTTTLAPVFTKALRYQQDPTEVSTDFVAKKDDDCNDKMLPCPDTVNVTYPLNGYCNRYVSCESGRAIRKTCPEGLHFNIITKSCDLPHNSFCIYTCPAANGYYGIPGDCGGYFVCKNFIPDYRMCPPRMHWDLKRSTCTFAELSSCPMKCAKASEVKHYEGDCKAYVICLNGIPYYHKCPPNTKFDRIAQTCVPDEQSKCEDDPRLLTRTSNPNHLCRDVEVKLGTKIWCNYVFPEDNHKSRKQFDTY